MQVTNERDFIIRRWSDLTDLDWYILGPALLLLLFNMLLLKSAAVGYYLPKQFTFYIPAFFIGILTLFISIKFWHGSALWIYCLNVFLLLLVLLIGASAMGAQRWINIGFIKVQPSEFAKIAIIISLAAWFTKYPLKGFFDLFLSSLITALPFVLIFKQPDLGTSLAFMAIFFGMAFWAGASITHLLIGISPLISLITNACSPTIFNMGTVQFKNKIVELNITEAFLIFIIFLLIWLLINYKPWRSPWIVLSVSFVISINFLIGFIRPILWNLLRPYQQQRLIIFLNPESDPQGAGYHIIQSILAIGNGGVFGYGWQNGRLTRGNYVPAQHTDFIFSTAGEEFGFIGSVLIVILFTTILWRILYIAKNSNNRFSSLVAIGIFSFFAFHIFINIGMTIGLMPITGVPLPFLSYGGTALMVDLFSIFLLLSISWRTLPKKIF